MSVCLTKRLRSAIQLPPKPPSSEEINQRTDDITRRIVTLLSSGNTALQQGAYVTEADVKVKRDFAIKRELQCQ